MGTACQLTSALWHQPFIPLKSLISWTLDTNASSAGFLRLTSCTHRCLPAGDQLLLTTPSSKCHSTLLVHIRPQTPLHSRPLGPAPAQGPEIVPELSALHLPHERSAWVLGESRWGEVPSCTARPHVLPVLWHRPTCSGPAISVCEVLAPATVWLPPPSPASTSLACSGLASTPSPCLRPKTLLHLPGHSSWAARTRFHGRDPVSVASG